jgi:hypothetical protein
LSLWALSKGRDSFPKGRSKALLSEGSKRGYKEKRKKIIKVKIRERGRKSSPFKKFYFKKLFFLFKNK